MDPFLPRPPCEGVFFELGRETASVVLPTASFILFKENPVKTLTGLAVARLACLSGLALAT